MDDSTTKNGFNGNWSVSKKRLMMYTKKQLVFKFPPLFVIASKLPSLRGNLIVDGNYTLSAYADTTLENHFCFSIVELNKEEPNILPSNWSVFLIFWYVVMHKILILLCYYLRKLP